MINSSYYWYINKISHMFRHIGTFWIYFMDMYFNKHQSSIIITSSNKFRTNTNYNKEQCWSLIIGLWDINICISQPKALIKCLLKFHTKIQIFVLHVYTSVILVILITKINWRHLGTYFSYFFYILLSVILGRVATPTKSPDKQCEHTEAIA